MSILLVSMSASFVTATSHQPWSTIKSIVTLDFMSKLGINSTADPFEGFIRFAILILLFAVFYALFNKLGFSKNITITVALVFSIISAIFIPGSVLVAAGAGYGAIIGLILLAMPFALVGIGYFATKESPWAQVVLAALAVWLLGQMETYLSDLAAGAGVTSVHFQTVISTVEGPIYWIYWI